MGVFPFVRWCECLVDAVVGVTYNFFRFALQRLHQLSWPRSNSLGVESSSSFEVVVHGTPTEPCYQSILDSLEDPVLEEVLYEEVEDREDEDEGVVLEGDAGFAWGDSRWEQWRWEEEHNEGDYRRESEEEEEIFEFQWGDEEEDWE